MYWDFYRVSSLITFLSFSRIFRNSLRISRPFERYFYSKKYGIWNVFEVHSTTQSHSKKATKHRLDTFWRRTGEFGRTVNKTLRWFPFTYIGVYTRSHGQEKNSHHESLQHVDFGTIIPPLFLRRISHGAVTMLFFIRQVRVFERSLYMEFFEWFFIIFIYRKIYVTWEAIRIIWSFYLFQFLCKICMYKFYM